MRLLAGSLILSLASCASMGPTVEVPCYLNRSSWNSDDPNPVSRIVMLNVNRYCGVSVRADYRSAGPVGSIITKPANGDVRVRRVAGTAQAEYQPRPGFAGEDEFKAQLDRRAHV